MGKRSNSHRRTLSSHERKWGFLFSLPTIIFFLIFLIYPTFNAFFLSLFKYDIFTTKNFVGFKNYITLFSSEEFQQSFTVTLVFVFGTAVPTVVLSLLTALVLNKAFVGRTIYRTLFFMPSVMSLVAVAIIFTGVFDSYGVLNYFIGFVYKSEKPLYWLSEYPNALIAIILVRIWRSFGYYMVLYLAGLQGIPNEYYEAAEMDGVNWWNKFRHITWPLLAPTTAIVTIVLIVNAFKAFAVPYVMTKGGPAETTRIIPIMLYEVGFRFFKMGRASAISIIMLAFIAAFSFFQFEMSKRLYGE
jgi:ABC-type sugar transport system permease subunit